MALIKCPECQKEISDTAPSCPNCGKILNAFTATRPKKKKRIWIWVLVGFVLVVFMGALLSDDSDSPKAVATNEPAFTVTPDQICREYEENEIASDKKYKGKLIRVTGFVDDVKKGLLDSLYVTFKRADEFAIVTVQCFFDDKYEDQLASLQKGSQISIQGTGDGLMGMVHLVDCVVVQ